LSPVTNMPSDILAHNRSLIEEFRTNGFPAGRALLLLTTTGRRTGEARTSPMMYVPDGERLLVIAANAGAVEHPMWYGNLVAEPHVHVEVGAESYDATAVTLTGDERAERFAGIVENYPFFGEYQQKLTREIPVVALERSR
jgi:deazaflavin-dependent oxidoreductase (nitroreductase family)